jgi:hypothetical protein
MGRPIAIISATAAVSEPEAAVSCFEDVAMMSEAVEERGRHLGVTEDGVFRRPRLTPFGFQF